MNQRILCHFQLESNGKYFEFAFVPGAVNFDDVYAAFDAFKVEIEKLKVAEEERVKKAQEEQAVQKPETEAAPEVSV